VWAGLGLTPAEVEAYNSLVDSGPVTASSLAKTTGQSRGRIYLVLHGLVERGFVREEIGEPHRFSAVPSREILDLAARASRRRAEELETLGAALPVTAPAAAPDGAARKERAYVLHGRRTVSAEMLRILERAEQRYFVAGAGALTARISEWPVFLRTIGARARQGLRVALACPNPDPATSLADQFPDAKPAHVTTLAAEHAFPLTMVVADKEGLLVTVDPDNASPLRGEDFAIHLDGRAFADAMAAWFERVALGHPGAGANVIRHLVEAREEVEGAIAGARREVVAMGSGGWLSLLFAAKDVAQPRPAKGPAGAIARRLVTEADPSAWRVVRPLAPAWRTRMVRSVPVWAIVVDETTAFVGFPGEEKDGVTAIRKVLDPAESRHYQGIFDRLWSGGTDVAG
jgi:transcriptional regulator TrmB